MILREENLNNYLADLQVTGNKALFIFFPNFEERSVSAAQLIASHWELRENCEVIVYTLQGEHRPEILDEIKSANSGRVFNEFSKQWRRLTKQTLGYPNPSQKLFQEAVRSKLANLAPIADLVLDISAVPRDMLFQLFEFLFPVDGKVPFKIQGTEIRHILFLYSWAERYPRSYGPELLGDLKGYHSDGNFGKYVEGCDKVRLAICGAGTGHDATGALKAGDQLIGWTHDVFLFLNRNNVLRSYEQMMCHQSLMKTLGKRNEKFRCVFSVEHFSAELDKIVGEAILEHKIGNSAFIVGPFGPKPFGLCGFLSTWKYRRAFVDSGPVSNRADVLNLSSGQYLSVYSIGCGATDLYRAVVS